MNSKEWEVSLHDISGQDRQEEDPESFSTVKNVQDLCFKTKSSNLKYILFFTHKNSAVLKEWKQLTTFKPIPINIDGLPKIKNSGK